MNAGSYTHKKYHEVTSNELMRVEWISALNLQKGGDKRVSFCSAQGTHS